MDEAFNSTREEIKTGGDRVIRFGQWGYPQYGVAVFFDDANNHQLTWGVLGSALIAIESYMQMIRAAGAQPGSLKFDVFDGKNQVGIGTFDVE